MPRVRGKRRWRELSPARRACIVVLGLVEVTLAVAAWRDLARRPASGVRGPKWGWALVIGINIFGPLSYFRWGRLES